MTINKVVRLGTVEKFGRHGRKVKASIFCKIEFDGERLSIMGVVGPTSNGDAYGSCGQITIPPAETIDLAPAWSPAMVDRFREVWDHWHLNNMRAGCEHQRRVDTTRTVEVVTYKLTHEALDLRTKTLAAAATAALNSTEFAPSPTARALAELDRWYADIHQPPDADSPLSGCYEVAKRETKAVGWVTRAEHSDGLLSEPCEVCGYKYGTAWLHEDVPPNVLEFLTALPDTDQQPAWV